MEIEYGCFKCGSKFTITLGELDTDKPTCDSCFQKVLDITNGKEYRDFVYGGRDSRERNRLTT